MKYSYSLYVFLILLFFNFLLPSDIFPQKKNITIEDEIDDEIEKSSDSVIEKEEIVVEGEDEKILQPAKDSTKIINPEETEISEWSENASQITKKEKQGVKKIEKRAQIKSEYGLYSTLGIDIYVTKRDDLGLYLLEYGRLKKDSEGRGKTIYRDSETSIDNLNLVSHFNINTAYKLMLKTNYIDDIRGLQNSSLYSKQFKRGGYIEVQNQFRPSEAQKLNISLYGVYISSDLEEKTLPKSSSSYTEGKLQASWQYIFGRRNSLSVLSNFWYGELNSHYSDTKKIYRSGKIFVSDIFPIYRNYIGEDKTLWEINITAGFKSFFAADMKSVFGPYFVLDSFWGKWHSKLLFEREAKIPLFYNSFLNTPYSALFSYENPEDMYKVSLKNRIPVSKNASLNIEAGYEYYYHFFEFSYQLDGIYLFNDKVLRQVYGTLELEQNLGSDLFYSTGITGFYYLDNLYLKPNLASFLKSSFRPGTWEFSLELTFMGKRKAFTTSETWLKPYTLLNLIITKEINPTVNFFIKGENLLNQNYILMPPYHTSGIKGYGGINILF